MARKNSRREAGSGTIRQRKDGTWEARYCAGRNPKTGKVIRRSIYGKTQREVAVKLRQITTEIDANTYVAPCATKYADWLDTWIKEYLTGLAPLTVSAYESNCRNYIKPELGHMRLDAITPAIMQKFINRLVMKGLSPKTIKNIHGVVHRSFEQAKRVGHIRSNPAEHCNLPKVTKPPITPLADEQIQRLLHELKTSEQPYADLFRTAIFTGMRKGELLGLKWGDIDFKRGTILVQRQLVKLKGKGNGYIFTSPKDDDSRLIQPASSVIQRLKELRQEQAERVAATDGVYCNEDDLVFTNDFGGHLAHVTVSKHFKQLARELDMPNCRFHDLRHTFAVISLENGDDIKTVQSNLGHATASFTLDVYGHVNDRMRSESAQRMEAYTSMLDKS